MSARNRTRKDGSIYTKRLHDFFETPEWVTKSILERMEKNPLFAVPSRFDRVLEPAAGNGAITRVLRRHRPVRHLTTVELSPARSLHIKTFVQPNRHFSGDFRSFSNIEHRRLKERWPYVSGMQAHPGRGYSLIMTNPPFSMAETYVLRCMDLLAPNGFLVLLLRLAFLESQGRVELHRKYQSDVYVLPRRPSFTGDGQSDMSAYAWFCWGPACGGYWEVLPP